MAEGTVASLFARVGFKTDDSGAKTFERTLSGLSQSVVKFGSLLGVGMGAKQILDLGMASEQVEASFRAASTGVTGGANRMQEAMAKALGESNGLNKELKDAVHLSLELQQKQLTAAYFSEFQDGSDESLAHFSLFVKTAANLAAATGEDIRTTFGAVLNAATSGSLSALERLPGIGREGAQQFAYIGSLMSGAFATPMQQTASNIERTAEALSNLPQPKFDGSLKNLANINRATDNIKDALTNLGAFGVEKLAPLVEAFGKLVEKIDNAVTSSKSLSEFLGKVFDGGEPKPAKAGSGQSGPTEKERFTNLADYIDALRPEKIDAQFMRWAGIQSQPQTVNVNVRVNGELATTGHAVSNDAIKSMLSSDEVLQPVADQIKAAIDRNRPIEQPRQR